MIDDEIVVSNVSIAKAMTWCFNTIPLFVWITVFDVKNFVGDLPSIKG